MDPAVTRTILLVLCNALAVFIVARIWPGVRVRGFGTSILVAIVFGVLNYLLWWPIAILGLPFVVLTFGIFLFLINGLLLLLTSKIIPDFEISGCLSASFAAALIALLSALLRHLLLPHGVPVFWR